jgi:hypothetical protein
MDEGLTAARTFVLRLHIGRGSVVVALAGAIALGAIIHDAQAGRHPSPPWSPGQSRWEVWSDTTRVTPAQAQFDIPGTQDGCRQQGGVVLASGTASARWDDPGSAWSAWTRCGSAVVSTPVEARPGH